MEVHSEVLPSGQTGKVAIIDDILATGGSAPMTHLNALAPQWDAGPSSEHLDPIDAR